MASVPQFDIEQYYRTYSITNFSISDDEKKLVYSSNLNGRFNLWGIDLPNGSPSQLSSFNKRSLFTKIDPCNNYVLTEFDNDDRNSNMFYTLPINGGETTPVMSYDENYRFFFTNLSEDGKRIYYSTTKDNPYFLNLCCYNTETNEEEVLLQGDETTTQLLQVSPNEKSFVYMKAYSNSFIVSYIQNGNEVVPITPDPTIMHTSSNVIYANDSLIYFVTNFKEDFSYVASFDIETLKFNKIVAIDREDVTKLKYNEKENSLYFVTENGVIDSLYKYDLDKKALNTLESPVDLIEQLEISKSGTLFLLGYSATLPYNIFKQDTINEWSRLTDNQVIDLPQEKLVEPEIVSYSSGDFNIEALLYKAKPEVANGYTVFCVHGGPQSADRKSYRSFFQYLLANGYNIFTPNYRGSTGYGEKFSQLVEKDWGEGPRLDCLSGLRWLIDQNIAEKGKIFVFGGSFGGYMSLLLAGRHSDYLAGAVDMFGPSNLVEFIQAVPEQIQHVAKKLIGDPVMDEDKLLQDSPITYIDSLTKPLLVIQGANDTRITMASTDKMVEALEEKEVDVEYLVLADEAQGFTKKENELEVYRQVLDFFDRHIEKE